MIPIGVTIPDEKLLIDVTYDELLVLVNNSKLVKGQKYRLTDYETTYNQPITNAFMSSGIIEVLHITATDVNKLHKVCQSELYPEDIVYYEITGNINNEYGTEGFTKGKIYRRIDTIRNNDIGTDWRHIKYNRVINSQSVDILLFTNYDQVFNNIIQTYHLFNSVVGASFSGNEIGNYFENNTIGHSFYLNIIKDSFANNNIENEFYYNNIKNSFYNNNIGNNFQFNDIKNFFRNNDIKRGFKGNKIEQDFENNSISVDFKTNIVGISFQNNGTTLVKFESSNTVFEQSILNIVSNEAIALSNVSTTVFKLPNGQVRHRYYDSGGGLVIAPLV